MVTRAVRRLAMLTVFSLACAAPAAASPHPQQAPEILDGTGVVAEVELHADGSLRVTESLTVVDGGPLERSVPLRISAADDTERVYAVADLESKGPVAAEVVGTQLRIRAEEGESTVSYTLSGAVSDGPDEQLVRWHVTGAEGGAMDEVVVLFTAATPRVAVVTCFAGLPGSTRQCTLSQREHTGELRVVQRGLAAGERMEIVLAVPAGTAAANASVEQTLTLRRAFAVTTPVLVVFGGLGGLLAAVAAFVVVARRRDAAALVAVAAVDNVLLTGERVQFASPGGVLPGQVGLVFDEVVDPVDLASTVIDLAVRQYLWVAEIEGPEGTSDWQLSRRNPADHQLHEYEKALYEALLPEGKDSVTVAELHQRGTLNLSGVRQAMYEDAVTSGWLTDRVAGRRKLPLLLGSMTMSAGIVAVPVLAYTTGHALVGVAVAAAGAVVLALPRLLPARTAAGRALVGQIRGMLHYLGNARAGAIPERDQETVFSRSLPYAVVLGETEHWIDTFADLDPEANGASGVYWFGGFEGNRDLHRFAAHFPHCVAELEGLFAHSAHLARRRV